MFDAEDEWIPAINALICRSRPDRKDHMIPDPDPKPLADMLRSGKPIPAGIRDTLAELLDPTPGNIYGVQIFVKEIKSTKQFKEKLPVAIAFKEKRKDGMTVEVAAEKTGEEFGVCDRTVRRDYDKIEAADRWIKNHKP